jgi:hypothetical protein
MDICTTITKRGMDLQVSKKGGDACKRGEQNKSMREAKGLTQENDTVNVFMHVYSSCVCYLRVTWICV